MASGDLADLRDRVRNRGNFSASDTGLTATVIDGFVNESLRHIALEHDWPWLKAYDDVTTVAGTDEYPLPAGILRTTAVIERSGYPLLGESVIALDEQENVIEQGRPVFYSAESTVLTVRPVPDAAYALRHHFVQAEAVLAADGDLPRMPVALSDGIVEYATFLALRFVRQEQRAGAALDAYKMWLKTVKDEGRRSKEPGRVRVTRFSPWRYL